MDYNKKVKIYDELNEKNIKLIDICDDQLLSTCFNDIQKLKKEKYEKIKREIEKINNEYDILIEEAEKNYYSTIKLII